jgi:hypothetical protein
MRGVLAAMIALGLLTVGLGAGVDRGPVEPVAQGRSQVWEFRTADGKGHFYTASAGEADRAEKVNKFQRKADKVGSLPDAGPNTMPIKRLRFVPHQAYLVTGDQGEIQRLVGSKRFVEEGVLGHVFRSQQPGTVQLKRFSKNNDWRLAPAPRTAEFQRAGYRDDGPLGWVYPG